MGKRKPELKKLNADTYQLKWPDSGNWATIALVDHGDNRRGNLMIQSDWGDYHAGWGGMGQSLRDFLVSCNNGYIEENLCGRPDWVDEEATKKAMKKYFKEQGCSKADLESHSLDVDDFFGELDGDISAKRFWDIFWRSDISNIFKEPMDVPCVVDYTPQFRRFMKKCWPEFIKILKGELNESGRRAQATTGIDQEVRQL